MLNLRRQGIGDEDIVKNLKNKKFSPQQINDAINQAVIKENIDETPEAPSPGTMQPSIMSEPNIPSTIAPSAAMPSGLLSATPKGRETMEMMEELAESIVNEKWQDLMSSLGNIVLWKEKIQTDIRSIKQEVVRVEERFENLQKAVLEKIGDYDKHMLDVGSEVRALEKVMSKIIEPLTQNIKELNRVTQELKARKKK